MSLHCHVRCRKREGTNGGVQDFGWKLPPSGCPLGLLFFLPSFPAPKSKLLPQHTSLTHPAADWMQGPYVYALYQHYGFAPEDIATLFIAGLSLSLSLSL